MNEKISQLMAKMATLEDELLTAIHEQESKMFFEIKGKRVEFESSVRAAHKKLKTNFFRWLVTNRPQNLITGPVIYAMIVPLMLLDVCVSFYQWVCFPVYGVTKVKRADYIVFDRHQLHYLNFIEKFHCTYCEYGNGLMGYMAEILARTEEYFCPIKHAHKVLGTHARYRRFLNYGDAADYAGKLEAYRVGLGKKTPT
jgi:hypothetical protein